MMLGLGDVAEHDLADFFRVDFIDEDDDERHEELARLQDDLGGEFVVRYPERIERKEREQSVVDDEPAVIDLVIDDTRWVSGMQD